MDSPLAKALLGKHLDDEIFIRTPEGDKNFIIADIEYKIHASNSLTSDDINESNE